MKCGHCGTNINVYSWNPLYRTCDAYVCSPACSRERMRVISRLDPNLTQCIAWANTMTITPPKTLSKKLSYVALSSMTDDLENAKESTPLHNVQNRYAMYNQTESDINDHYEAPRTGLLRAIGDSLASICMTALTLGVLLIVS